MSGASENNNATHTMMKMRAFQDTTQWHSKLSWFGEIHSFSDFHELSPCLSRWLPQQNLQDTSASEVHLQSLKALADVARGVSLAVPLGGAQGYALALCLAQILELQRPSAEAVVTLGEQLSFIITLSRKCRKSSRMRLIMELSVNLVVQSGL